MTTTNEPGAAATHQDPYGRRSATLRVLANALLVLLAFEVVWMTAVALWIATGADVLPMTPLEALLFATAFYLVRWLFPLPGLLPVLVGIEYVARHAPHARLLTAIVASAPMLWWELTQSSGDLPSTTGALLGVTAVLFAVLARLPARSPGRSTADPRAPAPSVGHVAGRQ